jgi:hypothetical protein
MRPSVGRHQFRSPIPRGPCDGLPRRLPDADHPVLSASVCGQAVAIEEICAESLRIGHEFQRERVLYRWSCSPADPVTKLSQSHPKLAIDMDSHRKFS